MMHALILLSCAVAAIQAQYPGYPGAPAPAPVYQQRAVAPAPPAPIGRDGTVIDTPEVAQAKAAHFAEFARAAARAAEDRQPESGAYGAEPAYPGPASRQPAFAYSEAPAPVASFGRSGYGPAPLQYQPQSASPAYHQQAHFAQSPEPKAYQIPAGAKAPFQPAPLAEDGTVVDTAEVAALKAARLQELAAAEQRAYKYGNQEEYSGETGQYQPQAPPPSIPRTAYASEPAPGYPGVPSPAAYPGAPQGFTGRAFQPAPPAAYQQAYHGAPGAPQSYQQQY